MLLPGSGKQRTAVANYNSGEMAEPINLRKEHQNKAEVVSVHSLLHLIKACAQSEKQRVVVADKKICRNTLTSFLQGHLTVAQFQWAVAVMH